MGKLFNPEPRSQIASYAQLGRQKSSLKIRKLIVCW